MRKSMRSESYTKYYHQLRDADSRRNSVPTGNPTTWLSLNTYIEIKLCRMNRLYLGIYVYTHIHICMEHSLNSFF